jgi:hypothetical protein
MRCWLTLGGGLFTVSVLAIVVDGVVVWMLPELVVLTTMLVALVVSAIIAKGC